MKTIYIMSTLMLAGLSMKGQEIQATTNKKTFSRTTSVSAYIDAPVETVWKILTDAAAYPSWNTTVVRLDGEIKEGEKIRLTSTLDPDREFKLKVKDVKPGESMIWKDMMGKRTYKLKKKGDGVLFVMTERIGGLMFPLFANKIPSFDESFTQFALDLKRVSEM